ncbi:MAG: alpha/beta hydrolase family esterase [Candidatus Limnocylindrales bacterium]
MNGSAPERLAGESSYVKAGIAGVLVPVFWAAGAAIEVARSNIGHSLISRPERFFSDSTFHWPLVFMVAGMVGASLIAGLTMVATTQPRGRLLAGGCAAMLALAAIARVAMALLLPSDPGGYSVSALAALSSNLVVVVLPIALLLAAVLVRQRSPGLAWLSAGIAIAMVWVALWAMVWAARSGASQPQLLAVEPVEGLAAAWSAAVGARLLGWRASLPFGVRLPELTSPGRKSAVALALVLVAGVVGASSSFVSSYEPEIVAQLTGRTKVETIHADAVDRTYRVYRPAGELAKPGLVIVLHGAFGGGLQIEATTGFDAQADRLGWIVVYPDGVADGWDAFGSGPTWGNHPGADDVVFIRALIDRFKATDRVDPDRVYVTGHSRGGMMTYRLGCELSGTVAAIAPVSGNMAAASGSADVPCTLAAPVSVLAIHGTADGTIPIAGGKVDIIFSPMADVIARWRSLDNCTTAPTTGVDGVATTTAWACAGGSTVSTRILAGGCHCWPGDASRLIADFFVAHPRVTGGG